MNSNKINITNRLGATRSPYLRQHATNPVHWQPWDDKALDLAKTLDKPIILSIGYSTCHWCHVMAHESFEDPAIAAAMNRDFVCIKVDREEQPDLDRIYMNAVTALTGSGGWPLNAFLTPDLKPFFGGTYFPPRAGFGIAAWPDLVAAVSQAWQDPAQRAKIMAAAEAVTQTIGLHLGWQGRDEALDPGLIDTARRGFAATYDPRHGGFGSAPKFPNPAILTFLLECPGTASGGQADGRDMVFGSLKAMARGGIHDQIGGGFHRYSTDERWHVPHFEKMLYDNAQLLDVYLKAHRAGGDPLFAAVARDIADYVIRDLALADGGFAAAEDADSPGGAGEHPAEGAFYLWSQDEVVAALGTDLADLFTYRFGVLPKGNARSDPHGFFKGKNILYQAHSLEQCAEHFGLNPGIVEQKLDAARQILFTRRGDRSRPHRDEKRIVSWNAMMIGALARAAAVLDQPAYLAAARKAARFIHANLYRAGSRRLWRCWFDGKAAHEGLATDYAALAAGLIALFDADGDRFWRDWAVDLTEELLSGFADPAGGVFYTRSDAPGPHIVRTKEDIDNVTPSAASVAVGNLIRLAADLGRDDYRQAAIDIACAVQTRIRRNPTAAPLMLAGIHRLVGQGLADSKAN